MQSLRRMIKRGNAHLVYAEATKTLETVTKRGTPSAYWRFITHRFDQKAEDNYKQMVTRPLKTTNRFKVKEDAL